MNWSKKLYPNEITESHPNLRTLLKEMDNFNSMDYKPSYKHKSPIEKITHIAQVLLLLVKSENWVLFEAMSKNV